MIIIIFLEICINTFHPFVVEKRNSSKRYDRRFRCRKNITITCNRKGDCYCYSCGFENYIIALLKSLVICKMFTNNDASIIRTPCI